MFIADSRHLGPSVLKTLSVIGQFKWSPVPETPEGVVRTNISDRISENERYEGEVNQHGMRDGRGHLICQGTYYEGYFKDDLAHGRGRKILADGDFYEGEFVDGKACGYGRRMVNDDFLYEGYWKND